MNNKREKRAYNQRTKRKVDIIQWKFQAVLAYLSTMSITPHKHQTPDYKEKLTNSESIT